MNCIDQIVHSLVIAPDGAPFEQTIEELHTYVERHGADDLMLALDSLSREMEFAVFNDAGLMEGAVDDVRFSSVTYLLKRLYVVEQDLAQQATLRLSCEETVMSVDDSLDSICRVHSTADADAFVAGLLELMHRSDESSRIELLENAMWRAAVATGFHMSRLEERVYPRKETRRLLRLLHYVDTAVVMDERADVLKFISAKDGALFLSTPAQIAGLGDGDTVFLREEMVRLRHALNSEEWCDFLVEVRAAVESDGTGEGVCAVVDEARQALLVVFER